MLNFVREKLVEKHEQNPIPVTNYTIHTQSSLPFPQENKFLEFPRQMQTLVLRIYTASIHNGLCTSSNHRPPYPVHQYPVQVNEFESKNYQLTNSDPGPQLNTSRQPYGSAQVLTQGKQTATLHFCHLHSQFGQIYQCFQFWGCMHKSLLINGTV